MADGIRWADGEPFVAEDICFTIDAILNEANPIPWAGPIREHISGCTVDKRGDTSRVIISYTRAAARPRDWLMFPILPAHLFDSTTIPADHPVREHAIGTLGMVGDLGPSGAVFRAVDEDTDRPLIRRFEILEMPDDPAEAVRDIEAGRVHGIIDAPTAMWPRLRAQDSEILLRSYAAGELWSLVLSADRPPLSDLRVRSALDLLIDRPALRHRAVTVDPNDPSPPIELVTAPFSQAHPGYDRSLPPSRLDPAQAASLLQASGWERKESGWFANGEPVTLTIALSDTVKSSVIDEPEALAKQLAGQLEAAGIKTVPSSEPDADIVFHIATMSSRQEPRELIASLRSDDPVLVRIVSEAQRATTDTAEQLAWQEVHRRLAQTHEALFLWSAGTESAWRPEVSGTIGPVSYWGEFGMWRFRPVP